MTTLRALPTGIRITRLDHSLATKLTAQARRVLHGDGSCSLQTMTTSCFASERCANGPGSLETTIADVASGEIAFVALSDVEPDSFRAVSEPEGFRFVGCVSGSQGMPGAFRGNPSLKDCDECMVLYNLCVAEEYRKHGVGQKLIQHMVDHTNMTLYLLVRRYDGPDENLSRVFRDRTDQLRKFYTKHGFQEVDNNAMFHLFLKT